MKNILAIFMITAISNILIAQNNPSFDWGISQNELRSIEKSKFIYSTNNQVKYEDLIDDISVQITYSFDSLDRLISYIIKPTEITGNPKESINTLIKIANHFNEIYGNYDQIIGLNSLDEINDDISNKEAKQLLENEIALSWSESNVIKLNVIENQNDYLINCSVTPSEREYKAMLEEIPRPIEENKQIENLENRNQTVISNYSHIDFEETSNRIIKASFNYNTGLTVMLLGAAIGGIGVASDIPELAIASFAGSILGIVFQYVGNAELRKAGESLKKSNLSLNTNQGIGISLNF